MWWAVIIFGLVVLDQGTKMYISRSMELGEKIPVITNFFYITYWENKGAAWGIFQNGRYFFLVLTIILSIVLIYMFRTQKSAFFRLALTFVMAGAWGNFIDRLLRGSVVDFLDFYIFGYDFPIFNVADMCINIGTVLLAIYILFIHKEPERELTSSDG